MVSTLIIELKYDWDRLGSITIVREEDSKKQFEKHVGSCKCIIVPLQTNVAYPWHANLSDTIIIASHLRGIEWDDDWRSKLPNKKIEKDKNV